ncbi:MAG: hypothetical protein ABJC74_11520 [Gemmatimonadota bacterium]
MPIYVFGCLSGLLAAVAERGFEDLNERLEIAAETAPEGGRLKTLGLAYLTFGLERGETWKKIHAPRLWDVVGNDRHPDRDRVADGAWAKAWKSVHTENEKFKPFDFVSAERRRALKFLEDAARDDGIPESGDAAHAIACLVDGILWQTHFERVGVGEGMAGPTAYHEKLVDRTIAGWRR